MPSIPTPLKVLGGTVVALGFTFVGMPMLLIGGAGSVAMPWSSRGSSSPPSIADILTPANAKRETRLSAADRKRAIAHCMATFRKETKPGMVDPANIENFRRSIAERAADRCDCMVEAIEDRTSTLEFVMAMSTNFNVAKDLNLAQMSVGELENQRAMKEPASKFGIVDRDYNMSEFRATKALVDAVQTCHQK